MPDINICNNKKCTIRDQCYRFNTTPNLYYQSYTSFKQDKEGKCKSFIKLKTEKDESKEI